MCLEDFIKLLLQGHVLLYDNYLASSVLYAGSIKNIPTKFMNKRIITISSYAGGCYSIVLELESEEYYDSSRFI